MWAARRLSSPAEPHSQTRRSAAPFAHVGCSLSFFSCRASFANSPLRGSFCSCGLLAVFLLLQSRIRKLAALRLLLLIWAARCLSSPAEPHSQTRRSAAPFAHVGCSLSFFSCRASFANSPLRGSFCSCGLLAVFLLLQSLIRKLAAPRLLLLMRAARRLSSPAEPHSQTHRFAAPFAHAGCSLSFFSCRASFANSPLCGSFCSCGLLAVFLLLQSLIRKLAALRLLLLMWAARPITASFFCSASKLAPQKSDAVTRLCRFTSSSMG